MFRLASVAFCALVFLSGGTLRAQDEVPPDQQPPSPQQIARRCVAAVNQATERCIKANASVVHRCLPRLRELLAAGEREEAIKLARRCVTRIREQTEACNRHIRELCEKCIRVLIRLESPTLARRVRRHCAGSLEAVNRSAERATNAITQLFDSTGTV